MAIDDICIDIHMFGACIVNCIRPVPREKAASRRCAWAKRRRDEKYQGSKRNHAYGEGIEPSHTRICSEREKVFGGSARERKDGLTEISFVQTIDQIC